MALCSYASTVQAECVSSDDLTKGIIVTYDDGTVEIHRQAEDDQVSVEQVVDDEVIKTSFKAKGIYLIRSIVWIEGQASSEHSYTIEFEVPPSDMPLPKPGEIWETHNVFQPASLGYDWQRIVYEYGQPRTLEIGACSYKAVLVEDWLPDLDLFSTLGNLFLPELGTSFHVEVDRVPRRKPVSLVAIGR
jgi:hypothetical protein